MTHYGAVLSKQVQMFEGSQAPFNYEIYPSPDRYRQSTMGLNIPFKANSQHYYTNNQKLIDEQKYMLKVAATKELQDPNYSLVNSVNYNSKIINNQKVWNEINNSNDPTLTQSVICPTYMTQEPINVNFQQKSLMTYGNVTPISPNNNKLLTNCNLVGTLPNNEFVENSNFISDINSPAFKESIEAIQQQSEFIDGINNNVLTLSSTSLSLPDLKAINNGKLNLVNSSNNAELIAANTLLGPISNSKSTPILTDVVLMPTENYSTINQENGIHSIINTPVNTSKLPLTSYPQNYPKIENAFFSPALSPAINQIYPNNVVRNQSHSMPDYVKTMESNKMNKLRKNTVPLLKTTMNKTINKTSNSISIANLKSLNPLSLKIDELSTKEEPLLVQNMDVDQKINVKEKLLDSLVPSKEKEGEQTVEESTRNNASLLNTDKPTTDEMINTTSLLVPTMTSSPKSLSINKLNDTEKKKEENSTQKEEENSEVSIVEEKKEETLKKMELDEAIKSEKDVKMEMDLPESVSKTEDKIESKKENETNKEKVGVEEKKNTKSKKNSQSKEKKETKTIKTSKSPTKKEESKKKEKKEKKAKESTSLEKASKEKSSNKNNSNPTGKEKSGTLKKKDANDKKEKEASSKALSVNTPPKIKKPRFSAKKAKNDPAALEEHVLLKRRRNTEAARRSRQRKVQQMKNLEEAVARLTKELEQTQDQLKTTQAKYDQAVEEAKEAKEAYETRIKTLEEQLSQKNTYCVE